MEEVVTPNDMPKRATALSPGAEAALRHIQRKMTDALTERANQSKATFWQRLEQKVQTDGEDERIRLAASNGIAAQMLEDNLLGRPNLFWSPGTPIMDPPKDQSGALGPDGTFPLFSGVTSAEEWADLMQRSPGPIHVDPLADTSRFTVHRTVDTVAPYVAYMRDGVVWTESVSPKRDPMKTMQSMLDFYQVLINDYIGMFTDAFAAPEDSKPDEDADYADPRVNYSATVCCCDTDHPSFVQPPEFDGHCCGGGGNMGGHEWNCKVIQCPRHPR